jgi:uncharacterized membrane protein YgdD (TMEM256/DUF423 family)
MISRSRSSWFLFLGSIMAGIAVAAGAFGAHALKGMLDASMLAVFETAVRYQMYHALGLCIVAWAVDRHPAQRFSTVGWCFAAGIALFSGSLYVVALADIRWVGVVTPLGGLAFIAGWGLLACRTWQAMERESKGL